MIRAKVERILVVEDDPFTSDLLHEELQEMGYQTHLLANGKDAVSTAQKIMPDLILLDIMMPEIDGFAVCRALRKDSRTMHIPVIFITAKDTSKDLVHGLSVGANDYITKPFNMEVLAARIETQLRTKRLMDQVSKQNKELEKLNKTIKDFLGMASHDLRTPVSVIALLAATLLEEISGSLSPAQKTFLTKIHQQSRYMCELLDDLLNISHIESGKIVLHSHPEDINQLLKEILSSLIFLAKYKSIDILLDTDSSLPFISIDKTRFAQIIDNIVANAIKFTPDGGMITIKTAKSAACDKEKWALISITDTGIGIAPAALGKLFQAFTAGGSSPTKGEKSTGLGLSIAKKLTEMHEGKLEVSSTVGKGTEFVIKLPLL